MTSVFLFRDDGKVVQVPIPKEGEDQNYFTTMAKASSDEWVTVGGKRGKPVLSTSLPTPRCCSHMKKPNYYEVEEYLCKWIEEYSGRKVYFLFAGADTKIKRAWSSGQIITIEWLEKAQVAEYTGGYHKIQRALVDVDYLRSQLLELQRLRKEYKRSVEYHELI
jgi:hypothetical protein